MKYIISIFFFFTFSLMGLTQDTYSSLSKKLDGGYYYASNSKLKIVYNEEYLDSDSLLEYRIYNTNHEIIYSNILNPITIFFGRNLLEINTSSSQFDFNTFYLLEIINEKNEKWYLRFKTEEKKIVLDSLVLYYDFNDSNCYDGSGTSITDLVSQHNGTTTGSPTLVSKNVGAITGLSGNCMEFNGVQGINLSNAFNHVNWTVSFWFHYRGNNNYYQRFWGMHGYRMDIAEVNGYFYLYDGGWFNTGIAVPTSGWKKLTFSYQNSPKKITIRINGVEVYSTIRGRTMNTTAYISDSWDNHEAQSYIGEVLVYGKYLTDQEDLLNFNVRKGDYGY